MDAQKNATYHQCIKHPLWGAQGTVMANHDPFLSIETFHAKAQCYKLKGKEKAKDEMSQLQSLLGIHWQDLLDQ